MRAILTVTLTAVLFAQPVMACSFCSATASTRNTLREECERAKAVLEGTLKNPNATAGTTDFQIRNRLKSHSSVKDRQQLVIPKYYPVIGDTPPDYLLFLDVREDKPDVVFGVPNTVSLTKYVTAALKLDPKDVTKRLEFYFQHLDSADAAVSDDAFLEFAKASDADVLKAKASLDPKRLQKWLSDPKTPAERIGVYAMLLGLSGEKDHAVTFATLLKSPTETVKSNLGGVLAGYAMLEPTSGWLAMNGVLHGKRPFEEKFSALSGVRYLQATKSKDHRDAILRAYHAFLSDPDFVDVVIEDLRRWGWWELTDDVFTAYRQPVAKAAAVKKAIVRYALTCPNDKAKKFVGEVRKTDPDLVKRVEDGLSLLK